MGGEFWLAFFDGSTKRGLFLYYPDEIPMKSRNAVYSKCAGARDDRSMVLYFKTFHAKYVWTVVRSGGREVAALIVHCARVPKAVLIRSIATAVRRSVHSVALHTCRAIQRYPFKTLYTFDSGLLLFCLWFSHHTTVGALCAQAFRILVLHFRMQSATIL